MRNVAAMRKAMQSIARDASSARLGEKLPKERRQALLISIGVEPEHEAEMMDEGEETDDMME